MTSFKFSTPVKVRYNDTDQQGHVYFGQYYELFDEGVEAYLTAIGYDYQSLLADNTDFLYVESHCTYKSPAKWPEIINVHTRIGHIGNTSLRYEFEVTAQTDGRLIVTGHIVAVAADAKTFEPHRVPDRLRQAVADYEG